jgi:hypothetical protein
VRANLSHVSPTHSDPCYAATPTCTTRLYTTPSHQNEERTKLVSLHVQRLLVDNVSPYTGAVTALHSGRAWLKLFAVASVSASVDSAFMLRILVGSRPQVIGRSLQMQLYTSAGSNVSIVLDYVAFLSKYGYIQGVSLRLTRGCTAPTNTAFPGKLSPKMTLSRPPS